ncbi:hypothetical protein [Rhodopirellula europaea]|uniref:hypothetical protein n=1 Tax=Rhodopirellula europaea TaxID=1263866 RepID=UPI003D2D2801
MTHRIRLRRPWTREIFCDGQSVHRADRVDVPDASGASEIPTGGDVPGQATRSEYHAIYRRHFNCPTGLEENDRLSIEMAPAPDQRFVVRLNDQEIGSSDSLDLEEEEEGREAILLPVANSLEGQNLIEIELRSEVASDFPRCVAEVALRIDAAG